jgi:hypothetical protein
MPSQSAAINLWRRQHAIVHVCEGIASAGTISQPARSAAIEIDVNRRISSGLQDN